MTMMVSTLIFLKMNPIYSKDRSGKIGGGCNYQYEYAIYRLYGSNILGY